MYKSISILPTVYIFLTVNTFIKILKIYKIIKKGFDEQ